MKRFGIYSKTHNKTFIQLNNISRTCKSDYPKMHFDVNIAVNNDNTRETKTQTYFNVMYESLVRWVSALFETRCILTSFFQKDLSLIMRLQILIAISPV